MDLTAKTDGELLTEFAAAKTEAPFEELVRRHSPLVFSVCRRVMGAQGDPEDAAQAVFLTLAHKASSLHGNQTLAGWLHHVAWHIAKRAQAAATQRKVHEQEAGTMLKRTAVEEQAWRELEPLLDGELDALPEKYRLPIILHHLEGRTEEETARLLGCNPGTISTRLARARKMLRERMNPRGVTISALVFTGVLSSNLTAGEVPVGFSVSMSKAAALVATGQVAAAGAVSAQASALAHGALKMLFVAKMKVAVAALTVLAITGSVATMAAYKEFGQKPEAVQAAAPTGAETGEAEQIEVWLADLASRDPAKRKPAEENLRQAGGKARAALERLAQGQDAQAKGSAEHLLNLIRADGLLQDNEAAWNATASMQAEFQTTILMSGVPLKSEGSLKTEAAAGKYVYEITHELRGSGSSREICDGKTVWVESRALSLGPTDKKMARKYDVNSPAYQEYCLQMFLGGSLHGKPSALAALWKEAFDLTELGEEDVQGDPCWILSGGLNAGFLEKVFHPKTKLDLDLQIFKGFYDAIKHGRVALSKNSKLIRRAEVSDDQGVPVISIQFTNFQRNPAFDPGLFSYTPAPDTLILDGEELRNGKVKINTLEKPDPEF